MALQTNKVERLMSGKQLMALSAASDSDPLKELLDLDARTQIVKILKTLPPREEKLIIKRFGGDMTLAEIGKDFGISAGRTAEIEAKALRKLRHPARSKVLAPYQGQGIDTEPG